MAKSRITFNKKEREKKKQKKKEEKLQRKEDRKENPEPAKSLDDMIAYVDEFGNITDTPPDPALKKKEVKAHNIEVSIPRQSAEENKKEKEGVVSFFDTTKKFGFIKEVGTQDSFFVHESNLVDPIQEGDKVTFIPQKGAKGMDAVDVKKA